ncbi:MAG: NAD(P)H-dependent oxidoreductase [Bacteroidia bacterium]|nr:NAD(P)H-dependent oxidoreductase [Bacteroidia bacterium]
MITIISGTNRESVFFNALADFYQDAFAAVGKETTILRLKDLPREIAFHFPENPETWLPGLKPFQDQIDRADFFIFILPEYNGSLPGILKLFIDNCRFPDSFAGKGVALAGFSSGMFGNLRGLDHLDSVLSYLRAHTLPYRVHVPHIEEKIDESGQINAAGVKEILQKQVEEILAYRGKRA